MIRCDDKYALPNKLGLNNKEKLEYITTDEHVVNRNLFYVVIVTYMKSLYAVTRMVPRGFLLQ